MATPRKGPLGQSPTPIGSAKQPGGSPLAEELLKKVKKPLGQRQASERPPAPPHGPARVEGRCLATSASMKSLSDSSTSSSTSTSSSANSSESKVQPLL